MGMGTSTFVTRCINFLTMVLAMAVIIFGVWMSTRHDACRKSLTIPMLSIGAVIFLISIVGFLGAMKRSSILLWGILLDVALVVSDHAVLYLGGNPGLHNACLDPYVIFCHCFRFIVTNNGSGHSVTGLRYKEYQLQDYSSWFLKELNNSRNWKRLRVCLVKTEDCNNLSKKYKTLKHYKLAKLTPIEAGCCRPPSECGYPAVNASYYDLTFHPVSPNNDCKRYKNSRAVKCYDCDSCKAGVAQYMKTEWRVVAIFNVVFLLYTLWDAVRDEMQRGTDLRAEEEPICIHETSVAVSAARDELVEFIYIDFMIKENLEVPDSCKRCYYFSYCYQEQFVFINNPLHPPSRTTQAQICSRYKQNTTPQLSPGSAVNLLLHHICSKPDMPVNQEHKPDVLPWPMALSFHSH
ncbi:hypothetical protein TSUD_77240 [Trifolium subterraneum]|uniref:Tetraspanin-10 n=1 Tax=Trifolium subterraneum TaxID=3900 RepID=A0A2Z6M3K7_TRISU|nr:hypothetical protein TSUD_77240 [Trifolium subterraneum]